MFVTEMTLTASPVLALTSIEQLVQAAFLILAQHQISAGSGLSSSHSPQHESPQQDEEKRGNPQDKRVCGKYRPQEDEFTVTFDEKGLYLGISTTGCDLFANYCAEILSDIGIGIENRLVLADNAAQLGEQAFRTLFLPEINRSLRNRAKTSGCQKE